ncbi:MAG TPA: hypothetical protein VHB50_04080 [Bryobacteraceae bacterium]|nr:hypothetical protein [Bryobacteraceae bacterium]
MVTLLLFIAFSAAAAATQPAITPAAPPVVQQNSTFHFSADRAVTWSLAPGSAGTIDPDGTYHAPSKVFVNQSIDGCPVLPPDHAYNVKVDKLPLSQYSTQWVQYAVAGKRSLHLGPYFPTNLLDSNTPWHTFGLAYTPANNGSYQVPDIPALNIESGYYYSQGDRHYIGIRPDTCDITEIYNSGGGNIYPTSSSGIRYNTMSTYLPSHAGGATDAAGQYLVPYTLRVSEVLKALATGGSINHPIRVTLTNYSQIGGGFVWPASAWAASITCGVANCIPYGGRFRLKASYAYNGSNPVTALIIKALKEYGLVASDGGFAFDASMDADPPFPQLRDALLEVQNTLGLNLISNLEGVDDTVLAPSNVTAADGGLINPAAASNVAGFTPPQFAQVIATDTATGAASSVRVALRGAALDIPSAQYAVQAGADPFTIPHFLSGTVSAAVSWSMSPSAGALDPNTGVYTPPATVSAPTAIMVTVASQEDSSLVAQTRLIVLPAGPLGLMTSAPGNYTDTRGQKWWTVSPNSDYPVAELWTAGAATPYDDGPVNSRDAIVYKYGYHPRGDTRLRLRVPNGKYKITAKMKSYSFHWREHLETQGQIIYYDLDPATIAPIPGQPVDLEMPATVTDGQLEIVARRRDQYGGSGGDTATDLPAVMIQLDPSPAPHITITPPSIQPLTTGKKQQLYCVGWYMPADCQWQITSGPGTIDANGLYTAPAKGYDPAVPVVVTATSASDNTKTATTSFSVTFGDLAITPATVSTDRQQTVQFAANISSVNYGNVNWTVSPQLGSIDNWKGTYTAPDTLDQDATVTVTATSTDNPAHSASTTLLIRAKPQSLHIAPGTDYPGYAVDSSGVRWTTGTQYFTCTGGNCYPGASADHTVPLPTPSTTYPPFEEISSATKLIWDGAKRGWAYGPPPSGDFQYLFPVPNGVYDIKLGFNSAGASKLVNGGKQDIWVNGVKWLSGWDTVSNCGINVACSPPPYRVVVANKQILLQFKGAYKGIVCCGNVYGGVPAVTLIEVDSADSVNPTRAPGPVINNFSASPAAVRDGGAAVLSWSVSGAASVVIDPDIGSVPAQGKAVVSPSASTTYTLTALTSDGVFSKATARVVVSGTSQIIKGAGKLKGAAGVQETARDE